MSRFRTAAVLLVAHLVLVTAGVAAAMWGLHGTAAGGLYGGIVALWTLPLTLFAVLFMRPQFSRPRKKECFSEPARPLASAQCQNSRSFRSARGRNVLPAAAEPSPAACAGRRQSLS